MAELWLANAFVGPAAGGNATGVVVLGTPLSDATYAEIARRVRAPDTVFVTPRGDDFEARFFSPFEGEMSFCGQALIATEAVLRARGTLTEQEATVFTATGPVTVAREDDRSWFHVATSSVRELSPVRPLPTAFPMLPNAAAERVIDSGRRRIYRELPSPEALEQVMLPPERVLAFCRGEALSGICLYARIDPGTVALRVFTVSLEGGEDVATGGAVLGLGAIVDARPHPQEIRQGAGHLLRRGRLHLRHDEARGTYAVGGTVDLVARGQLLP